MRLAPLAVALALCAAPAARAATAVVLLPATGANVPEAELAAATDVLRADLEKTGAYAVTIGDAPGGLAPEATAAQAGAVAAGQRADLAVTIRISRLGGAAVVRVAAYRPDGALAHTDQLSSTGDDLDVVLSRLARGLAGSGPAARNADLDSVTAREALEPRRRQAVRGFGVKLGGTWLEGRPGTRSTSSLTSYGIFWQYDGDALLADLSLDGASGDGDGLSEVALGVYLPLLRGNFTPYVGGGAAYTGISANDRSDSGLAYRGAVGILFNRLSTLQLRFEAGWQVAGFTLHRQGKSDRPDAPFVWGGLVF